MKKILANIILKYLQNLTRRYVEKYKVKIVGLTGSSGKTTLTLCLHSVLSTKYKVGMTYKDGHGLNSESGIPFAVLNVHVNGYSPIDWIFYLFQATYHYYFNKPDYELFIVEMGVDKPNDMDFILSMIRKVDVGIFLSISTVHAKNFEFLLSKENVTAENLLKLIFDEKAKLIKALGEDSYAVLNNDEKIISDLSLVCKAKVMTFGLSTNSDIAGKIISLAPERFEGEVRYGSEVKPITITNFFVNNKNFNTLLAAIAVGIIFQIPLENSIAAVQEFQLPAGRMSIIDGIRETVIIDSSYNASKLSMLEAIDNLALFNNRKKIAVLGDMRELGEASKPEHEEVARYVSKIADEIVLIGPQMKEYFLPELMKSGYSQEKVKTFDNTYKALDFVRNTLIAGGEAVLIKGSQNTLLLEIIVEGLMKNPELANKLLCRRGEYWDRRRAELNPDKV